jgi:hypothetical protein
MPVRYPESSACLTRLLTPLSNDWSDVACSYDNATVCGKISTYRRLPGKRCKQDRKRQSVNGHDFHSAWGWLELTNKLATFIDAATKAWKTSLPIVQKRIEDAERKGRKAKCSERQARATRRFDTIVA